MFLLGINSNLNKNCYFLFISNNMEIKGNPKI
jgi:hypothetical protein